MSRRKQANPAKLDSELGECTAADEVSPVTMEAEDSAASVSEKDEDEEDNSATPVPSVSDFDDGDAENASSTPDASSPTSPLTEDDCTQGVTETTPYGCRYCQKAFPRSCMLTRHEQTHTEQLQFTCSYCPRLFKHKRSRDRHTKLHTGDKKYKCQHCDSAFSRSDHLKIHMKTHDGRKPYKCGTCNRGYNTAAALASHQQNHLKRSASRASSTPSPKSEAHNSTVQEKGTAESAVECTQAEDTKTSCLYCARTFPNVETMYHHASVFHADATNGSSSRASPKRNGTPLIGCDRCTMHFENMKALSEHLATVHWKPPLKKDRDNSPAFAPYQSQPTDLSHKKKEDLMEAKPAKKLKTNDCMSSPYESDDKPCICSCCYAQMPNFKSFLVHMESHVAMNQATSNNSFIRYCPICGEPGRDPIGFSNHLFAHAITNVPGRCCHPCKKSFDGREDLQKHLAEVHMLSVFKCSICSETFDTKAAIQVHFSNKHANDCNHFKCYLCSDQIFHDRLTAELHVTMQHAQLPGSSMVCSNYQDVGTFRDYLPTFQCPFCPKNFKQEHLYFIHVLNDHSESQEQEWMESSELRTSPENSRKIDSFSCEVCNLEMSSENELVVHRRLHHTKSKVGAVSLQCAYCNECCKSRNDLENHMKNHHVSCGKGKYKCNICDEIFTSSIILADHKLRHCKILSGNTCTQCKAVLVNEQSFYAHHIEHSPGKTNSQIFLPVNCIICCQTLQTDVELRLHSKFHLKYLNQRSFLCGLCNQVYDNLTGDAVAQLSNEGLTVSVCKKCSASSSEDQKTKKTLEAEEVHEGSNLECRLCKQVFPTPVKLQVHLIEHNFYGMNQYSCYVCSSVFTGASGLQSHIVGHGLKSRPYECSQCQMKFFFRAELDNHRFVHLDNVKFADNGVFDNKGDGVVVKEEKQDDN